MPDEQDDSLKKEMKAVIKQCNETVDSFDQHYQLGGELYDKGDWNGAESEYRRALRLDPTSEDAHISLGNALREKGDRDGAVAEYREALRLNPENYLASINLNMVSILEKCKKLDEIAEKCNEQVAEFGRRYTEWARATGATQSPGTLSERTQSAHNRGRGSERRSRSNEAANRRESMFGRCHQCEKNYRVLGISPNATAKEVSAAYRDLAKIFHSDRLQTYEDRVRRKAEGELKEINEAYAHISSHWKS